jgi:signal transduction histidine kinase
VFTSIRWRLAASYALIILLSVTLTGTIALYIVQNYVGRQEKAYLKANAEEIADLARHFFDPQLRRVALEELAATSAFLGDARVRILGPGREVIADSGDPGLPDDFLWLVPSALSEFQAEIDPTRGESLPIIIPVPSRPRADRPISPREFMPLLRDMPLGTSYVFARRVPTPWGRRFVFENIHEPPGPAEGARAPRRKLLSIVVPVGYSGTPMGWVEMSSPLSLSGEAIAPMRNAVLFSGLGALLVAAMAGFFIGRTISDPLRILTSVTRQMADGDLSVRAASTRADEIGELARQFDGMAENLETSFRDLRAERDSLKRFVADASHELRTPITALATFNELLQGSAADDHDARQEFLRESQTQLARLQWITANLLDLSRLDGGIAALKSARHAAADIVGGAVAGSVARATERGITLSVRMPAASVEVVCDRNRIEMALANLVGNAVKFVQDGGTVGVETAAEAGLLRFVVTDNGPGIAPEDLPHVFERFFRGRNARSEGAGLGLAIAQSIARAHGGSLRVQSEPGAGCVFTLEIPLDASTA